MGKYLKEAIQITGATLIGSAHGFDVFDILTYEAAQAFQNDADDVAAGRSWTQSANTFNSNINENMHLYFFVRENTNKVVGGLLKSNNTHSQIILKNAFNNSTLNITVNGEYENCAHNSEILQLTLPLYLIPDIHANDVSLENGFFTAEGILKGILGCFREDLQINELTIDDSIREITSNAFNWGTSVLRVVLPNNPDLILDNACMNEVDDVYTPFSEEEVNQNPNFRQNWLGESDTTVHYDYGTDVETIENRRLEREQRDRQAETTRITELINNLPDANDGTIESWIDAKDWRDPVINVMDRFTNASEEVQDAIPEELINKLNTLNEKIFSLISTAKRDALEQYHQLLDSFNKGLLEIEDVEITPENYKQILEKANQLGGVFEQAYYRVAQDIYDELLTDDEQEDSLMDRANSDFDLNTLDTIKYNCEEQMERAEELLRAQRNLQKIRYKVVGKEIHILGTRKGATELDIPEVIDGKPVTVIEAYAFFNNKDLTRVTLPNTLKRIERCAFANCEQLNTNNLLRQALKIKNCFIGRDAFEQDV